MPLLAPPWVCWYGRWIEVIFNGSVSIFKMVMPLKCLRLMLTGLAKITSEVLEPVSFQVKSISHCSCIAKCLHPCQNPMNTAGMHPLVGFHVVHLCSDAFTCWLPCGYHHSDDFTCGLPCGASLQWCFHLWASMWCTLGDIDFLFACSLVHVTCTFLIPYPGGKKVSP